jgi:2-hydroxy-4-carboxymuconate semialdehyde hemiacetal dehydrogenase
MMVPAKLSPGLRTTHPGDTGTYIARYDDLVNGKEEKIDVSKVDVSMNEIELQDREFFAAIQEGREPNASVAQVLPCDQMLHSLDQQLALEERPRSWLRG